MIILKVTKTEGFTHSLEDTFFGKSQGGSNWPPSRFRVKLQSQKWQFLTTEDANKDIKSKRKLFG